MQLKPNVGTLDRIVRVVLGLVLVAYAIPLGFENTGWNWIGWIGIVLVLSAVFRNCPLYSLLGISTCPAAAKS